MRKRNEFLPKLLKYIEQANKIPLDFQFPAKDFVYDFTFKRLGNKTISDSDVTESYKILFKDFPKDLFDFIFVTNARDDWEEIETVTERIHFLSSLSYGLVNLANCVTERQELINHEGERYAPDLNDYFLGLRDLKGKMPILDVELTVNEKGNLEVKTTDFFKLLTNYQIEATRIRACLVCRKIFWAKRLDNWACTKSCGNILRQHRWQEKNKNEHNEKRRRNYAYNQAIKKIKEKK